LLWLLLQTLAQILLLVKQAGSSTTDKTIHIGYLMEDEDRSGAINVAIEQAQNDGLLRDYNFRYNNYFDSDFQWRTNTVKPPEHNSKGSNPQNVKCCK